MSIYDNVAAGLRLTGTKKGKNLDEVVKHSLERATLWDEVKDDLKEAWHEHFRRTATAALHCTSDCSTA